MNFLASIICIMHCIFVNIKNDAQLSKILRNMPMLPFPRNTNYYRTLLINKKNTSQLCTLTIQITKPPILAVGGGGYYQQKGCNKFWGFKLVVQRGRFKFFFVISLDALVIPSNKKYYCCSFTYFIVNRVTSTEWHQ